MKMSFAEQLTSKRELLELTQIDASALLGVSLKVFQDWERGCEPEFEITKEGALARLKMRKGANLKCINCGTRFKAKSSHAKYCSDACSDTIKNLARKNRSYPGKYSKWKMCAVCGKQFLPKFMGGSPKTCRPECSRIMRLEWTRKWQNENLRNRRMRSEWQLRWHRENKKRANEIRRNRYRKHSDEIQTRQRAKYHSDTAYRENRKSKSRSNKRVATDLILDSYISHLSGIPLKFLPPGFISAKREHIRLQRLLKLKPTKLLCQNRKT